MSSSESKFNKSSLAIALMNLPMIFSKDAPKLEAALHNAFADRRLNFVNQRREFFRVSLKEIEKVVHENFDGTADFTYIAPAEQYRQSLKMREQQEN